MAFCFRCYDELTPMTTMDMIFSEDWLRKVAKEEEDVRFSVGGWVSSQPMNRLMSEIPNHNKGDDKTEHSGNL